jgi:hypothetical protein
LIIDLSQGNYLYFACKQYVKELSFSKNKIDRFGAGEAANTQVCPYTRKKRANKLYIVYTLFVLLYDDCYVISLLTRTSGAIELQVKKDTKEICFC